MNKVPYLVLELYLFVHFKLEKESVLLTASKVLICLGQEATSLG